METIQPTRPAPGEKSSDIHRDTPSETAQELELEKSMEENEGPLGLGDESAYPKETRQQEDRSVQNVFPGSAPEIPPVSPPTPEIQPDLPNVPGTFPDLPHAPEETPDVVPEAPDETPPMPDIPEQAPIRPDEIGEVENIHSSEEAMPVPTAISEADQQNRLHPAL